LLSKPSSFLGFRELAGALADGATGVTGTTFRVDFLVVCFFLAATDLAALFLDEEGAIDYKRGLANPPFGWCVSSYPK
jgi:hypothetical protein